jgi:xanthine dehydrogenase YagT iron-sulfur-binding subunit
VRQIVLDFAVVLFSNQKELMMKRKRDKPRKPRANEALTRRDFLKGASAAVSGGLLAGQAALASPMPAGAGVVGPGAVPITLRVNDKSHQLSLEPRVTLLDALRNNLDLTGAKRVCDRGVCGSCTVIMDDKPVYACNILAVEAQGRNIMTIECLAEEGKLSPMMTAFVNNDAQQCGFCTPGFVMACTAYVQKHPNPSREDVEKGLGGNLCRCGTYMGVRAAVLEAARTIKA